MEIEYRHTQFGYLTLLIFLLVAAILAPVVQSMLDSGQFVVGVVISVFYILILIIFFTFTVEISENNLRFWFGISLVRKSYPLGDIQSSEVVKNPWYFFWGIKSIPGGWLYAIAPGTAVEIVFKDGKIVRLGTNEPNELKRAIDLAITSS